MPMPVHGARTTDGAFQTAAMPRKSNAWLRCGVSGEGVDPIHSPEQPTGPRPGAGILPTRPGAIGAPINLIMFGPQSQLRHRSIEHEGIGDVPGVLAIKDAGGYRWPNGAPDTSLTLRMSTTFVEF